MIKPEYDAIIQHVTGCSMESPPIDLVISARRRGPILKMCRSCTLACKKHEAPGLTNFKCFDFTR